MTNSYQNILNSKAKGKKLLAILLDPDKLAVENLSHLIQKINQSPATHIFVGGSSFDGAHLDELIIELKSKINLPFLLFPGNPSQISDKADGILFLTLLSGRNPDYLIEHQVNAVPIIKKTNLEVISTGYILIESGNETAVERVSQTKPLDRNNFEYARNPDYLIEHQVNAVPIIKKTNLEVISTGYILIESGNETAVERVSQTKPLDRNNHEYALQTAQAGEFIGNKLIYLEAGSGAKLSVPKEMIALVSQNIKVPLLVGGGIRSKQEIEKAYNAGADIVVIGTAFENDNNFFNS